VKPLRNRRILRREFRVREPSLGERTIVSLLARSIEIRRFSWHGNSTGVSLLAPSIQITGVCGTGIAHDSAGAAPLSIVLERL
jgi:hypothetical protein